MILRRTCWSGLVGGLIFLASASSTFAQDAAAPEYDSDDLVARGLFDAGRAAYDAGNYREALNYFQQAHDKSQRPRLLYNIGQTADRLRMDRTALTTFRKYLELVPDAENRREVENRIRTLESLVNDDAAPAPSVESAEPVVAPQPSAVTRPAAAQDESASDSNIAPWLVTGAGGVVALTGVVLFAIGSSKISNAEDAPIHSSWPAVRDDAESGPTYRDVGITALVVGVLGTAAGVVWIVTSSADHETTVSIGPNSLLVRGTL